MAASNRIAIGIDGGGTSCRAALMAHGRRQTAQAGPANVTSDFDGATQAIVDLVGRLLSDFGLAAVQPGHLSLHLGLAGVTGKAGAARVEARIGAAFPGARIRASGDQVTMIRGALGAADGAVAGIGTGSFVIRQSGGALIHVGGRGLVLGDQASGAWLGLRLLQEVMLAFDGFVPMTDLARTLIDGHGADPERIIAFARDASPADFAALAPDVVAGAKAGDAMAVGLMEEGARYIGRALATTGWRPGEPVCLTGGLGPCYQPWLAPAIAEAIIEPKGTALDGALQLAAEEAA